MKQKKMTEKNKTNWHTKTDLTNIAGQANRRPLNVLGLPFFSLQLYDDLTHDLYLDLTEDFIGKPQIRGRNSAGQKLKLMNEGKKRKGKKLKKMISGDPSTLYRQERVI